MNPIDQMMQSFSANPSAALAGLLGTTQVQGSQNGIEAAQFASALEGIQKSGGLKEAFAALSVDKASADNDITKVSAELLASLGFAAPVDGITPTTAFGTYGAFQLADGAGVDTKAQIDPAALNILTALQQSSTGAATDGAPGLEVLPQAALEQLGLRLEQLPALPSSDDIAAIASAGVPSNGHLLPASGLDALVNTAAGAPVANTEAVPGAQAVPQPSTAAATALTPEELAAVQTELEQAPAEAPVIDPAATPAATDAAPNAVAAAAPAADGQVTAQAAQQTQQAKESEAAAQAEADEKAQLETQNQVNSQAQAQNQTQAQPEGHGVANAAAQASKSVAATASDKADAGIQHRNSADFKAALSDDAAAASLKEALTSKPVEAAGARPEATATPLPAREPTPPLTPERLAGLPDNSAVSSMASGLGGMKGESSFMSSMSLMGGKASPEFASQIAQQMNLQVSKAVKAGQHEFTVRLDPAELGRVQVRMHFLEDGKVQAHVMAERPETLHLLQKDSRGLERALEAAGQKADGGIQFSLDTSDQESAGRAFAEAVQQEKMRDELASRSAGGAAWTGDQDGDLAEEIPLEDILAHVSVETGVDIRI